MTDMLSIARDFSPFPAGRKRGDGPYTGEKFREDLLAPRLKKHTKVILDLDGVEGLPSSFLEEIFGGLVREGFAVAMLRELIEIRSTDPELSLYPGIAWRFAAEAEKLN